jgi:tetratricopeptide (TPR) repeat protein
VFTRESTPLLWAKTQNNLGAALAEQGMRGTGEEGLRLLLDAIQCYRAALEVRTFESLPQEWASTQNNLASVYYFMKDWPKVAESYTNVLKVFPNSQLAYRTASELHQKVLFNFDLAFKLNQDWLKQNPNDLLEKVKFAEKLFTTGKYPESLAQVTEFVQNKDYSGLVHSVMRIIEVPNLIALKKAGMIPAKLDTMLELVKSQPENFRIEFNTAGMLYYVNQNTLFESYRVWLEKFFGIIAGQNRDAIYITLEEAKKAFPSTNSN